MKRRRRNDRTGAVAVEMALTLPLLFFIVFTSIEFSRMNVIQHTVDNAAYEAARRGIVPGATEQDVDDVARSIMRTCGARGVEVTVNPSNIQLDSPEITVTVAVEADQNGFLAPRFFRGESLIGRSTLTREVLQRN